MPIFLINNVCQRLQVWKTSKLFRTKPQNLIDGVEMLTFFALKEFADSCCLSLKQWGSMCETSKEGNKIVIFYYLRKSCLTSTKHSLHFKILQHV